MADAGDHHSSNKDLIGLEREVKQLQEKLNRSRERFRDITLIDACSSTSTIEQPLLKTRRTLKGHQGKVLSLNWTRNNRRIVSSSQDGDVIVWDAFLSHKDVSIPLTTPWVTACSVDPSGYIIACGGLDNKCSIYDLQVADNIPGSKQTIATHTSYVSACLFVHSNCQLLTASGDTTCALWDVETSQKVHTFHGHKGDVLTVDLCPAVPGNLIASGSSDSIVKIWDLRNGFCTHSFKGHIADVNCVKFFPNGDVIGSASDDTTCRLFDLRAMQEMSVYKSDSVLFGASSLDFSLSGRLLFAGYHDFNIRVWDTLIMEKLSTVDGHENRISSLQVSSDGLALATASWDHTIKVWA